MKYFDISNNEYELIINRLKFIDLQKLKKSNILIFGGTGFIGKWLVGTLLKIDDKYNLKIKLTIVSRSNRKNLIKKFSIFSDDRVKILNKDIIKIKTIKLIDVKYCVHLATDTAYSKVNNKKYIKENIINGSLNILKIIKKNNIPNIIFASSGAVYDNIKMPIGGFKENIKISEENLNSKNYYSNAKKIIENKYLKELDKKKFNVNILRIFTLVGPHLSIDSHYAIANFIKRSLKDKNIKIQNPNNKRSYLYIGDLITWMLKVLMIDKKIQIYNVGSNKGIKIIDLARKIIKQNKSKSKIIMDYKTNKQRKNYIPNINLAKKDGFKVYTNLEKSISKYINFIKSNL